MEKTKKSFSIFEFIGKLVIKIALFFALISALCTILAKVSGKKVSIHVDFDDINENEVEAAEDTNDSDEAEESDAE